MKLKSLYPLSLALAVLLAACQGAAAPTATAVPAAHWTYEGEEGPSNWGDLDPTYAQCKTGKEQSPIDIANPAPQDLANISFSYQPSELRILNNGHTIQANYDAGSYIELDGKRYNVAQFHYHAPSEHTVNGKSFEAELHIVHKSEDGKLAVVGLLLETGEANPAFEPLLAHLPAEKSAEADAGVKINAADFLPSERTTYRYAGSLTTPPCSEGVSWLVMTTPVQMSAEQLGALTSIFEGNNRPVQPLNTRTLLEDNTP